jgi:hypothetical protein
MSKAIPCQLVSSFEIVIAQFDATQRRAEETEFIRYDGRVFQKGNEHGGGPLSFYEIRCHNLAKNDVKGMKPL